MSSTESMARNARINQLAIGLVCLILIGGMGFWFSQNFKQVRYTARSEMSPEARRNPLLAAERLLTRLGLQAESQSGRQFLIRPPEEPGVLLVRDLGAPLSQQRVDDLLAWVESGGHLIATPGRLQGDELERPLLERFGVDLIRMDYFDELDWLKEMAEEKPAETTSIRLANSGDEPLVVEFDTDTWFEVDYPDEYWVAPDEGNPHLLVFPLGAGSVTFLSDSSFFENLRLDDFDHAVLLAELTAGQQRAWLLYSSQMPSLFALIWRLAPYLVVSLGLFAILLIWRMSRRSGPRITTQQGQRRDLLEHLQAAAEYNWRIDPSAGLLQQARKQVEKRWLVTHPQLQRLDQTARCEWLAERTGMTTEAIDMALYRERSEGGQMVRITANLQRLLTALHSQKQKR
ncbi:MAG: DUF4350 domain-containing protein [Candidatus Thiodiazotropha sp.]